jgi:hypothetical protein
MLKSLESWGEENMGVWDRFVAWLTDAEPESPNSTSTAEQPKKDSKGSPESYLAMLEDKLDQTVQDLADGLINRDQFENLYRHYQNQRRTVRGYMEQMGDSVMPEGVVSGESMIIRNRFAAKVLAYAVYDNVSSVPLHTVGDFPLESELVVGFFSGFRSAIAEIMGTGARQAVTEDGKVLIYAPGAYTTLIVVYSSEPADIESASLTQGHKHFEQINAEVLANPPVQESQLIFNYDMFLRISKRADK